MQRQGTFMRDQVHDRVASIMNWSSPEQDEPSIRPGEYLLTGLLTAVYILALAAAA
jgi:hypothetical protein